MSKPPLTVKRKAQDEPEKKQQDNVSLQPPAARDHLSSVVAAVLQQHVVPFLSQVAQIRVTGSRQVDGGRYQIQATSQVMRPDVTLSSINRSLRKALPAQDQLRVRTKQFLDLISWMKSWCEARRDLLIDVDEIAFKNDRFAEAEYFDSPQEAKKVGVRVLNEPPCLSEIGLPSLVLPRGRGFLKDPIQVEARDVAWRTFLSDKTPQEYEQALARFRTTMQAVSQRANIGSELGWSEGLHARAGRYGNQGSALEAVLQLVLGRNLLNADDYFLCMMWSLLEEFGAYAAWITASMLVWLHHYSGLMRYSSGMPSMFAHVARVMLDKDPRKVSDLLKAESELSRMRHPFEPETQAMFSYFQYGILKPIRYVWEVRGESTENLPEG